MKTDIERTLVVVKPDGYERGLVGECIKRFEQRGLRVAAIKTMQPTKQLVREHYIEHKNSDYYDTTSTHMMSGNVVAMILEGMRAVKLARYVIGVPGDSPPGTIRGDYGIYDPMNIVHGSDSREAAEREIELWFGEDAQASKIKNKIQHRMVADPDYGLKFEPVQEMTMPSEFLQLLTGNNKKKMKSHE